jgi:Tfp pilus assembly protein PilN
MRVTFPINGNGSGTTTHAPESRAAPSRTPAFAVNLIRKDATPLRVRQTMVWAGAGWVGLNLALLATMTGAGMQAIRERVDLQARMPGATPSATAAAQEMAALHAQAQQRLAQLGSALAVQRQEFPLGGKLAALTRTLPARTWLTELAADRSGRTVRVRASYLIDPEKPYDLPTTAWVAALKADPVFADGLTRLEPGASSRQAQGRADLFAFELVGEWNPS